MEKYLQLCKITTLNFDEKNISRDDFFERKTFLLKTVFFFDELQNIFFLSPKVWFVIHIDIPLLTCRSVNCLISSFFSQC